MNSVLEYKPQLRERIGWKLFPSGLPEERNCPFAPHDMVRTEVTIDLSFLDRLRTFLTGRVAVTVKTYTENVVGKTHTDAHTKVRPWVFLERSGRPTWWNLLDLGLLVIVLLEILNVTLWVISFFR